MVLREVTGDVDDANSASRALLLGLGARRVGGSVEFVKVPGHDPGNAYPLNTAADIIAKAGKPNLRMQFDFYHVQIVGGDLLHRLERHLPVIGHLQCAAVPSRHEPDEGEVNYRYVFEAVDRLGYRGWIGAEYRPRGRTEDGLGWAQPYGVVPAR